MNAADYRVSFRPTVRDALAMAICLGFVALGLWLLDLSPVVAVLTLAFFGGGTIVLLASAAWQWGRPALRVDADGALLGPIDAPAPRGFGSFGASLIPHVPPWVVAVSRPVTGWSLDRFALERAVTAHAPEVHVVFLG